MFRSLFSNAYNTMMY